MNIIRKLSAILDHPAGYQFFWRIAGGASASNIYLADYVKPSPGEKVLDLGCGTSEIVNYLPEVQYTGIDINSEYIRSAEKRFGSKGRFFCADIGFDTVQGEQNTFDLVLATGLIHHLENEQAKRLFNVARLALCPTGRLVTFDGCYVDEQSGFSNWMLANDRGKHVRTREEYLRLASTHFAKVESYIRSDLLNVPYTHLIMRCSR